jgi:hypothetical protein
MEERKNTEAPPATHGRSQAALRFLHRVRARARGKVTLRTVFKPYKWRFWLRNLRDEYYRPQREADASSTANGSICSDQYKPVRESAAQRWGVSPEIHPDDFILRFLFDHPSFMAKEDAIQHYFDDGANSAQLLHRILTEICGLDGQRVELLDFASGYGCVTRHLKNVIPLCKGIRRCRRCRR